jgi:hypothetical protein
MVDAAGVDLLIERLTALKTPDTSRSHYHIDAPDFGDTSPFGHAEVFGGIIIDWIGEPNLFGEDG